MTLFKVTAPDGEPIHGGSGAWSLPRQTKSGKWLPGRWRREAGRLAPCRVGLHLTSERDLDSWFPKKQAFTVWEAEARGPSIDSAGKVCVGEARLLRPVAVIDEGTLERWHKKRRYQPLTLDALTRFQAEEMAAVPRQGQPIVFGIHRLDEPYAPGWPTAEALNGARFRRMVTESRRLLGIPKALDQAVKSGDAEMYRLAMNWRASA